MLGKGSAKNLNFLKEIVSSNPHSGNVSTSSAMIKFKKDWHHHKDVVEIGKTNAPRSTSYMKIRTIRHT